MNVANHEAQFALWSGFALSAVLSLLSAMLLLWLARSAIYRQLSFAWPIPACVLSRMDFLSGLQRGTQPLHSLVLLSSTPSRAPPLGSRRGDQVLRALQRPDPDHAPSPAPASRA